MLRAILLTFFLLCVSLTPVALAQVSETQVPDTPPAREIRLPHPLGDAFLLLPAACAPTCSLVVVSHSRGMNAELSLSRPHLRRLFDALTAAGFAVLVSNDAGSASWGAPQTLAYLADVRSRAIRQFAFSGRSYNFGYSMGGLPALLTAYKGVYPVSGVLLLDAQVNLLDAWQGINPTFSAEVTAAQQINVQFPLPFGRDPLHDYATTAARQLPLFVAGSPQDIVVAFERNGAALYKESATPQSQLLILSGPHLGMSHFGDALIAGALGFLERLERAGPLGSGGP